jgi:regulator of protease activity HflC (stomatin/prohibitin superfamily)
MSPDGKDPGSVWNDPNESHWKQASEQQQFIDRDNVVPLSQQQPQAAGQPGGTQESEEDDANYEGDFIEDPTDKISARASLVRQLVHYGTLILAPLLFGALTCLFVLPLVATGHAQVPAAGLLPLALVIILIAIAQGVAVFYAGPDNGMWTLGTLGGFFLFVLVGCFAIFGVAAGFITLLVILVVCVALARLYLHPVPEGYVDIVYSLGKYSRMLFAGPHILLPWERVMQQLNVEETQWICPAQRVQLSRDEDVILRAAISYQVLPEDAYLAVTQVKKWEESLREYFVMTIQNMAATFSADDFIAWPQGLHARSEAASPASSAGSAAHWDRVNAYLLRQIRDKVAMWGVQINWVLIRDVELIPHGAYVTDAASVMNAQPAARAASGEGETVQAAQPKIQYAQAGAGASMNATAQAQEDTVPSEAVQHPFSNASAPVTPTRLPSEEVLAKAYKEVQKGNITDPETIRSIAEKFEAVAKDPERSKTVNFDAARAALNLYAQARKYEEEYVEEPIFEEETKPDWPIRHHTDTNLRSGG